MCTSLNTRSQLVEVSHATQGVPPGSHRTRRDNDCGLARQGTGVRKVWTATSTPSGLQSPTCTWNGLDARLSKLERRAILLGTGPLAKAARWLPLIFRGPLGVGPARLVPGSWALGPV